MMTVAGEVAKRIVSTRHDDLTPDTIRSAKIGLLDTIGVALAGSREEATRIGVRVSQGEC